MNYLDFFGSRRSEPIFVNTVFGGVGDIYNTPQLLANRIGIANVNGIKLFEIDNENNIRFSTITPYPDGTSDQTFYYDFDGNILNFKQSFASVVSGNPLERVISLSDGDLINQCFRLTSLKYAILPNIYDSNETGNFGQVTTLKRVYLPNWKNTTEVTNNNFFNYDGSNGCIGYFHKDMETINSGNPHASIQKIINSGNPARFIDNLDKPNPVTDLSVSNITANSAQLNFTAPPVNTNANDFYYVYLDWNGISFKFKYSERHEISAFYDEITGSGDTITALPANTDIKVQIQTVDFYHNVSTYSNPVFFKTAQ